MGVSQSTVGENRIFLLMLLLTFAECSHCAQHCYKNHVCNLTYASKQLGIIIIIIIIIIDSQDYKTEAK